MVFDAAEAAAALVVFFGAFVCDKALAAAVLEAELVEVLFKTFDALFAAAFPVTFLSITNNLLGFF